VQREATRLSGSGLIREQRVGRSRLISANSASRYTRPLTELVSLAFGPQFVIGEEFAELERAEQRLGLPVNPVVCPRQRWLAAAAGPTGWPRR
jgi:hypothetical protein